MARRSKYAGACRRVTFVLGDVRLDKLRAQHVQHLRSVLVAEQLGPERIGDILGVLSRALSRAVDLGLIARNWADRDFVIRPAMARRKTVVIDADLGRRILAAVRGTRFDAGAHLALCCTLRREEVLGLSWPDVDLDQRGLCIRHALTYADGLQHLGPPKTSAGERRITMPPIVVESLRRHRVEQAERRLLLGETWTDMNVVVDFENGNHWKPPSFSTAWRRFAYDAGFPEITFNILRHGAATTMLAGGVDDVVAARIMGHSDTRILRRYQDIVPQLMDDAAARVDALLGGPTR